VFNLAFILSDILFITLVVGCRRYRRYKNVSTWLLNQQNFLIRLRAHVSIFTFTNQTAIKDLIP